MFLPEAGDGEGRMKEKEDLSWLRAEIERLDPDATTPMEALRLFAILSERLRRSPTPEEKGPRQ
jgi:hypothetical protein